MLWNHPKGPPSAGGPCTVLALQGMQAVPCADSSTHVISGMGKARVRSGRSPGLRSAIATIITKQRVP